jgi:RNA methyltransferase, RsmE family
MQHFFVTSEQVKKPEIDIIGTDVIHIKKVLRMKVGEELFVSDGENKVYHCKIQQMNETCVTVEIIEEMKVTTELPSKIYLFQGLPKADKMELIVQKAVELGVHEVIPVITKRSVVKLDDKKAKKKVERWNVIAQSASKQAGRGYIPAVRDVMRYQEALTYANTLDICLIPYELAEDISVTREVLSNIRTGQSIGIFIGPEGGFEKEEIDKALASKAKPITLGRRILRTETAGLAILSILMYHLEEDGGDNGSILG